MLALCQSKAVTYRSKDAASSGEEGPAAATLAAEQDNLPHPLANPQATDLASQSEILPLQQPPGPSDFSALETVAQPHAEQQPEANEELVDLFASIEGLRQEVDSLPDPASLTPAGSPQPNAANEDQVSTPSLISHQCCCHDKNINNSSLLPKWA